MRSSAGERRGLHWGAALLAACLALAPAAVRAQDEVAEARQEAERTLAAAEAAAQAATVLGSDSDYAEAVRRDGEILELRNRAQRFLDLARRGLATAAQRPSPTAYRDAGTLAKGASREFGRYEERVRQALRAIELERLPPPPPPPPPPTGPPPALSEAAGAFLAGDYARVVEGLEEIDFRGAKARAHAHLLRAAARYALFLIGDEQDYALRGGAIEDVLACRREAPGLEPEESLFSPRFREFFAATQ